ncbi:type II 3-dehydroquinate dehydratase [Sporosarcina gallistercoris]|uniref:3-dehydroquinate dehydratase n=1 Tax=Sporosarcina gallistercoris TaxID=2762245 RepID=A0ABR8PF61_9BACL|nr:type II 3-dehydroquinate dehydratase [Sporosarcina gallistercoris]MBD7906801.1 type II 3-dehydroquinate dehydratase [Sporosarcina gallistercoris]
MDLLLLNGPNLNRLGKREPDVYGHETLEDIEDRIRKLCMNHNVGLSSFQSNHEGALIDRIHQAADEGVYGIVFNPGAYTHTSIAIRDAIASVHIPVVEVHISNIHNRESFRQNSMLAPVCAGQISGLGTDGYELGALALIRKMERE